MRTIVSFCALLFCYAGRASKVLGKTYNLIVGFSEYFWCSFFGSKYCVGWTINLRHNVELVLLDVTNLFQSIPLKDPIEVINKQLDSNHVNRIIKSDVPLLLSNCLCFNYVFCRSKKRFISYSNNPVTFWNFHGKLGKNHSQSFSGSKCFFYMYLSICRS